MALNIDECIEYTHLKKKVTTVIPTSNAGIEFLIWSVFSMLLRSRVNGSLEHICVCINGPDPRTGNPEQQDLKQQFLEELRDVDWYHAATPTVRRQMPLTVIRAWSRIGYAEAFEMALPWIHTDAYLLMHDDVLLTTPDWEREAEDKFYYDDDVAIAYAPKLLGCGVDSPVHRGMYLLRLPQLESTFMLCKKKWMMKAEANWTGYHIPSDENFFMFDFSEIDLNEFLRYYKEKGILDDKLIINDVYNFSRQEQGAWVYYKLCQLNKKFVPLSKNMIIHFEQMSRNDVPLIIKQERLKEFMPYIKILEAEIMAHPEYKDIYSKYIKHKAVYA